MVGKAVDAPHPSPPIAEEPQPPPAVEVPPPEPEQPLIDLGPPEPSQPEPTPPDNNVPETSQGTASGGNDHKSKELQQILGNLKCSFIYYLCRNYGFGAL